MADLRTASASDLVRALRRREVSSRELLAAQLARHEQWHGTVNAVVALDIERAEAAAAAADDLAASGAPLGPLHGLPMTIKDSFETEGLVTTSGAPELRTHRPALDADPVARLKGAGAIVFGKTNLPLWAGDWQSYNDVYGRTNNPWDPSRVSGGSSGGAAVAVATGISPLELGSDIGGSIRVPAHFCGVFGHKPSQGLVPQRGHIPGPPGLLAPPDLSVTGPLGRSVDDLELALDVLLAAGFEVGPGRLADADDRVRRQPRVAVHLDDPRCPLSHDVRALAERAAAALESAGASVVDVAIPPLDDTHRLYERLLTAVIALGMPDRVLAGMQRVASDPDDPGADRARDFVLTHRDWIVADERRHQLRARWARDVFSHVDVVLAPIEPIPAFLHDTATPFAQRTVDVDGVARPYGDTLLPWPGFATLPGLPATAVPIGRTPDGLPVGLQVVGPRFGDRTTLAVARLLAEATGGFAPPPEP